MAEDSPEKAARKNLLDRLLDSVKQCQVHFGARQEIATEADLRVATLCIEWEAVLLHGVKRSKAKASLRQIAGLAKDNGNDCWEICWKRVPASLWPLARLCLSPEETQRFLQLTHVTTDIGRGRAWLRAAINERTLENYFHMILANESKLQLMYEPHAFLLDQECSCMLPNMAAGLGSILFSIPIDVDYLNSPSRSMEVPPAAVMPTKSPPPVLLHQDDRSEYDSVVAVSAKEKKKKPKKKSPPPPQEPLEDTQEVGGAQDSLSSSPSMLSMSSMTEENGAEGGPPMFVALDPELVSNQISSEAEAAANATALVLSATSQQQASVGVAAGNTLSSGELREALLVMVKGKDEVEERNRFLEGELADVRASREQLAVELEQARAQLQTFQESHSIQQQALERENDLLREQLKKYVGMVQAQRRESSTKLTESLTLSDSPSHLPEGTEQPPQSQVLPDSEKKLSEMAEMYGEIMELNERLHRKVASKDGVISKLVDCIREAGLEVPVPAKHLPPAALEPPLLVDIWIPSVIRKGRGTDVHHVYQVFVKVKGDEWNVYRRYAEFREFHKQLQQVVPDVTTFQFPPKKAIGNKNTQVVEERRQRLQEFLRFVVRLCMTASIVKAGASKSHPAGPIIKPNISKETFVRILPFFKEDLTPPQHPLRSPSYSGL